MSRIGKKIINIPENVEVKIDQQSVVVKGPLGQLAMDKPENFDVKVEEQLDDEKNKYRQVVILPIKRPKKFAAEWGLIRSLLNNMIIGVTQGYSKKLEIEGVGYRAALQGNKLVLSLGYSHPIEIEAPEGIKFEVEKNVIIVSGYDKQMVGQMAAIIRSKRKPEPYKGKGIHYEGETIRRKSGKKAAASE